MRRSGWLMHEVDDDDVNENYVDSKHVSLYDSSRGPIVYSCVKIFVRASLT